jgi:hypothetical protein
MFARLVLVFACLMPRFLLLFLFGEREYDVNALQTNAHSRAIPKSSSSSQLHMDLGNVVCVARDISGSNPNGELRRLMSDMVYSVYYNGCIIIHIHIFFMFLSAG